MLNEFPHLSFLRKMYREAFQSAKDARVPMHVIVSLVAHLRGFAPVFLLRFVVPYAEAARGAVTVAHRSAIRLPSKRHCTKP